MANSASVKTPEGKVPVELPAVLYTKVNSHIQLPDMNFKGSRNSKIARRVFLTKKVSPKQLGLPVGLSFDSSIIKSMVPLNRDISDTELKGYLNNDKKRSGSIGHTKVETRPQNSPLTH